MNNQEKSETSCGSTAMTGYAVGTVFFYAGQTEIKSMEKSLFCGTWMVEEEGKSSSDIFQDIVDVKNKEFGPHVSLTALNIITA